MDLPDEIKIMWEYDLDTLDLVLVSEWEFQEDWQPTFFNRLGLLNYVNAKMAALGYKRSINSIKETEQYGYVTYTKDKC